MISCAKRSQTSTPSSVNFFMTFAMASACELSSLVRPDQPLVGMTAGWKMHLHALTSSSCARRRGRASVSAHDRARETERGVDGEGREPKEPAE